ncbi:unnamed protein product [Prorocentrum cordatum]|uniref:CCR4-NOT transcription complex subunit 1 CAF1-binding domain-containing protein n=1 Tax=Prorocentrum cordatum TaxID=2364126 RepID=A0ABN9SCA8_9DINO|nr:unnamed protein product [Polarella glacialis]
MWPTSSSSRSCRTFSRRIGLMNLVTDVTYDCLHVLLGSVDQAVLSTSHRTVLKNLGYWLGQITLARNKPLKSKRMDMKYALADAFENGRLTAVLPLVCKVLEGVSKSKVYKLPNPWTTAIMSLLVEIHDIPNLRTTNLMFEVEVLCKHLDIKIGDLKRTGRPPGGQAPPRGEPRPQRGGAHHGHRRGGGQARGHRRQACRAGRQRRPPGRGRGVPAPAGHGCLPDRRRRRPGRPARAGRPGAGPGRLPGLRCR